jgi:hypothetical protein
MKDRTVFHPHRPPVSYSIKSATIEVASSSTGNTRRRGALISVCGCQFRYNRLSFLNIFNLGSRTNGHAPWGIGTRPEAAAQLIREYIYLYCAVSPRDGTSSI